MKRVSPNMTPRQMLASLLARSVETDSGCRVWTARRGPDGYARIGWQGRTRSVHRLAYELQVGPVPDGLTLDHLCHTRDDQCDGGPNCPHRACLNVAHLEVVDGAENTRRSFKARRDHCINGHPYDDANTYVRTTGGRRACRACGRRRAAEYKVRRQMRAAGVAA